MVLKSTAAMRTHAPGTRSPRDHHPTYQHKQQQQENNSKESNVYSDKNIQSHNISGSGGSGSVLRRSFNKARSSGGGGGSSGGGGTEAKDGVTPAPTDVLHTLKARLPDWARGYGLGIDTHTFSHTYSLTHTK